MPRPHYPSDATGWFRLYYDDLLDNPVFEQESAEVFRFYINLMALLKRTRSRDGRILLSRRALTRCAVREKYRAALKIAREGAKAGLWEILSESEDGSETLIEFPNWAKIQCITPEKPQSDSAGTPDTETQTETQTETEIQTDEEAPRERTAESAGGIKPTCTPRVPAPESLDEQDKKTARENLKFEKPALNLTDDELEGAWRQFRERALGVAMTREKWLSEFGVWVRHNWPSPPPKLAMAGGMRR